MSAVATISDGQVVNASTSSTSSSSSSGSTVDKDTFLQLLVAQMKYQDPLEPTSNTEYISQYATFSQVEQLQNMATSMDQEKASSLVGKYVTMSTDSGDVSGKVDYVEYNSDNTLLYINGNSYDLEDLETVWSDEYLDAYDLCSEWAETVNELPSTEKLTLDYADSIATLRETYDGMTSYQKSFIGSSLVSTLEAAETRIAALQKAAEESEEDSDDSEETEEA